MKIILWLEEEKPKPQALRCSAGGQGRNLGFGAIAQQILSSDSGGDSVHIEG